MPNKQHTLNVTGSHTSPPQKNQIRSSSRSGVSSTYWSNWNLATRYATSSLLSGTPVSLPPPPLPPSPFPSTPPVLLSEVWCSLLPSAHALYQLSMNPTTTSKTSPYHLPPVFATVVLSTISTPNKMEFFRRSRRRLDNLEAVNHYPPTGHRREHHPSGYLPLILPCHGPRKEDPPAAEGRIGALSFCVVGGFGVRHDVIGALSALEANDPQEEFVVWRSG